MCKIETEVLLTPLPVLRSLPSPLSQGGVRHDFWALPFLPGLSVQLESDMCLNEGGRFTLVL